MKVLTIIFMVMLLSSVFLNMFFFYENYNENKIAVKQISLEEDNSPEFMKNGEWFNIILNGYNGER